MTSTTQKITNSSTGLSGPAAYWRSLAELEGTDAFQEFLHREFPQAASEFPEGVSRRRWLQLMSASFALAGAAGCRWETEQIAPFANRPEGYIPGKTEKYATNIWWGDGAKHLLVDKYDGRPIKIGGNSDHPASLGAADGWTQAATLALYDPDRSTQLRHREAGKSFKKKWSDFEAFLADRTTALGDGAGLAVLLSPVDSYSLYDALDRVAQKFPSAKFYQHAPLTQESALAGTELAFGERVRTHYRLAKAKVIATFDADPLAHGPDSLRASRDYADHRDPDHEMNRLYSVESQFSTTGAAADHRLPMKSSAIGGYLAKLRDEVARLVGSEEHSHGEKIEGQPTPEQFLEVLADDLVHNRGASVVIVGTTQPPAVHAIAHEINNLLGAFGETVFFTEEPSPNVEMGSLADLTSSIDSVDTLLILDGNPAYDAPADVAFAKALTAVPNAIRLGVYDDETARLCRWSLPETHPLEQWGDVIGWDGTPGVTQPMIEPLVGGRSKLEVLALLAGDPTPDAQQLVATALAERTDAMTDEAWNRLLHWGYPRSEEVGEDGTVESRVTAGVAFETKGVSLAGEGFEAPPADDSLEIVFTASSSTYDGRFANSGWLQETPDFLTTLTWDNAALVSPKTAEELGLEQGVLAELTVGDTTVKAPVYIMPGQAVGSIGLALGYGRTAAGRVGGMILENGKTIDAPYVNGILGLWVLAPADPVGVNAYPLRKENVDFTTAGVSIKNTGEEYLLATTQDHHAIDQQGLEAIGQRTGQLIREASKDYYDKHPHFAPDMSHEVMVHDGQSEEGHRPTKPLWTLPSYEGHAWGMSIDLSKCIGCSACIVACQAENNIPVVGKDQVARGREMHWVRVDRYFKGTFNREDPTDMANFDNPEVAHQPISCMHCETAPCEEVCPVAATTHSDEGLNDMVYNRCIGTRYCANNCPYKVRRFNYFRYTKKLYEADNELMKLVINPEVTVRSRGVMEKCTYCTQRISSARITAKNEGRAMRDGDVEAACQEVCASKAIEFGDLNDPNSRVSEAHASRRAYGLLTELMTKPRTIYLAKVRNPHPRLAPPEPEHGHGSHGHGDHGGHDKHEGHNGHNGDNHAPAEKHAANQSQLLPIIQLS